MAEPTAQLFDPKGKPLSVDDSDTATAAFKSGKVFARKGTSVGVYRPDTGELAEVPAENLGRALAEGATIAPDKEINRARLEAKWDKKGVGALARGVGAFGAGVVHGVGAGFLDPVVTEGAKAFLGKDRGDEVKEFIKDSKTLNPISRTVGDVVGTIGGIALTGGESGLARGGVVATQKGAARLAIREGEGLALKAAGETAAARAEKTLISKYAPEGVRVAESPAVEKTLISKYAPEGAKAPEFVSKLAPAAETPEAVGGVGLRDAFRYNPTGLIDAAGGRAERAVMAGVESALGSGSAARLGARVAGGATRGVIEGSLYGLGEAASESVLGDEPMTADKVFAHIGEDALLFGKFGAMGGAAGGVLERAAVALRPKLNKHAAEQYLKAIGGNKSDFVKLGRDEKINDLYEFARKNNLVKAGDDYEAIFDRVKTYRDDMGPRWRDFETKLGKDRGVVDIGAFVSDVRKNLLDGVKTIGADGKVEWKIGLAKTPGAEGVVANLENLIAKYEALAAETGGKLKIGDSRELRKRMDLFLEPAFKAANPAYAQQLKMAARGMLEDQIEAGVRRYEKEAQVAGLADEYLALKKDHQQMKTMYEIAEKAHAGQLALRRVSLSDYISGGAGLLAGAVMGGGVGGALGGAALTLGNKFMRTKGPSIAGWTLGQLADLGILRSFVDGSTLNIENGAKAFVRGKPNLLRLNTLDSDRKPGRPRKQDMDAQFSLLVAKVQQASMDPAGTSDSVASATAGMERVAPNLQANLQAKAAKSISYLRARIPEGQPDPIQPSLDKRRVSDADKAKFLEVANGTLRPMSLVEDLAKGSVSMDKVQAVRDNHPALFGEIQSKIRQEVGNLTAKGEYLPYQKRIQLGIAFGVETDPSLKPAYIKRLQANFQPQEKGSKGPGRPAAATSDLTKMFGTVFDKRAAGIRNP